MIFESHSSLDHRLYVGLDLSLTSPGMALIREKDDNTIHVVDTKNIKTTKDEDWFTRHTRVREAVMEFVFMSRPRAIFVENYSFGSSNGREIAGEVHGNVLYKLIEEGYPQDRIFRVIAPTRLKKFATGKGNEKKKRPIVEFVNKTFGLNLRVKDNDIADAVVLAFMGYCMFNYPKVEHKLKKYQKETITALIETVKEGYSL